jgi:outer membrane protein TolC
LRAGIEQRRFQQANLQAAFTAAQLAADAKRAYFEAVAARQTGRYMERVQSAAQASAELAARMANVDNWSKLEQARQQAFYADATVQVARPQNAVGTRDQLTRLLGPRGQDSRLRLKIDCRICLGRRQKSPIWKRRP